MNHSLNLILEVEARVVEVFVALPKCNVFAHF